MLARDDAPAALARRRALRRRARTPARLVLCRLEARDVCGGGREPPGAGAGDARVVWRERVDACEDGGGRFRGCRMQEGGAARRMGAHGSARERARGQAAT